MHSSGNDYDALAGLWISCQLIVVHIQVLNRARQYVLTEEVVFGQLPFKFGEMVVNMRHWIGVTVSYLQNRANVHIW